MLVTATNYQAQLPHTLWERYWTMINDNQRLNKPRCIMYQNDALKYVELLRYASGLTRQRNINFKQQNNVVTTTNTKRTAIAD